MAASTSLTREQRILRARIAATTRWARSSTAGAGTAGQAGLLARFEREARAHEPGLADSEYARRAESALKAHMGRLALASSKARARKVASDATGT
jgi:hypothetical protein